MAEEMKIEFGVEITPKKTRKTSEHEIVGSYWSIKKGKNFCIFEFDTGGHGGQIEVFETPLYLFDDLLNENITPEMVIKTHWRNSKSR